MRHTTSREGGFVTLVVLFTVFLVAALSFSLLEHGVSEMRSVKTYGSDLLAFELAEIGIARAEMELVGNVDHDGNGIGNVSGTTENGGVYDVTVSKVAGTDRWVLTSVGTTGHVTRRVECGVKLSAGFRFKHAIFAKDRLDINSSVQTDSFDSRLGTYASQITAEDDLGWYADPTGHIGSNAEIDIWSSVIVRGDAQCGPGESTSLHGGSCQVYGSTSAQSAPFDVPDPTLAEFEEALANNNNHEVTAQAGGDITYNANRMSLRVDGSATLTLSGGTYFFSNFEMDSSTRLIVQAPTKIYVTRNLLLTSSARVNNPGPAQDLQFIAHPYNLTPNWKAPTKSIELNSSMMGGFTLYAPGRDIYNDSSYILFGAIVGRTITLDSSIFVHYDRALGDGDGSTAVTLERVYWRDLNPPTR
ncbi:MAG: hypothetical protein QNJ90_00695 [Planctomycetota bacterium]|nr:hypothetical protein [Planctomycetota bacterium]